MTRTDSAVKFVPSRNWLRNIPFLSRPYDYQIVVSTLTTLAERSEFWKRGHRCTRIHSQSAIATRPIDLGVERLLETIQVLATPPLAEHLFRRDCASQGSPSRFVA